MPSVLVYLTGTSHNAEEMSCKGLVRFVCKKDATGTTTKTREHYRSNVYRLYTCALIAIVRLERRPIKVVGANAWVCAAP